MIHHRPTLVLGALVLAFGFGTTACAKTTIDTSVTTEPSLQTTTTVPTGTPAELLPRLVTEVGKLSDAIGNNDHKGEQIAAIDNLWKAVRPAIADTDGVLVLTFDSAIDLCDRAARFNRPADADKCFRNLTSLTDSFLAKNP